MKPCASCHELLLAGELVIRCACGRETCRDCLIPMFDEDATGPGDVAGWICQGCADELVPSGDAEDCPPPRRATAGSA